MNSTLLSRIENAAREITNSIEAMRAEVGIATKQNQVSRIMDFVAAYYGTTTPTLLSANRIKEIAEARHVAMYISRKTGASYKSLGRSFNRHHGAIMQGCASIQNRIDTDAKFAAKVESLTQLTDAL